MKRSEFTQILTQILKTDAIKEQLAKSKNISTEPRKTASGEVFVGGLKVKAISGLDSSKLRIKKNLIQEKE